ncbi:PAS domain S-box protein [Pedobacter alpinus]|uniref:histidine kinase n=1 Tax=Pedobacter alpinus TaxID=1590643 RepID=A0ABW5TSP6_9SPHI
MTNLGDTIFDQSRDLFWVVDINYLLVYANKSYQTLMLQSTGAYKKLNEIVFVEGFGEGYSQKWKSFYDRAFKGEYFEIEEHFYHPQNNEIQYGQNTFEPLFDNDNKVYAVSCQWKNITKIVKQRSEANQMMDASLDVFCTISEQGKFVFVSGSAKVHWGYTPEELVGEAYQNLIFEQDIAKTIVVAEAILSGQNFTNFENRYKKKDGGVAYNIWSARWDDKAKLMYCVARDGKEKLEKEAHIRLSEQRFKALVQEGSDMISIINAEGKYIYTSPTTTAILGITPEEFQGKNIFDFIHPEDAERCLACLENIETEKKIIVPPFRLLNNKNEWRWIESVLTNMLNNPVINGLVANSRDITDTINAQKQIEISELFNRTVLESSPDCFKVIDIDGKIQYINNNGLCQMEIDDFNTVKHQNWWSLWGKENEELIRKSIEKAIKGEIVEFTAYCPTAKGTPKWWDVLVSPVGKLGEKIEQIISVSRDITKRKKEEQNLKLLESVVTHTNDAVLITEAEPFDESGPKIIYVNEVFTKMTGYTADEVIGKTPKILQGPNSDKDELAKLGKAIRNWQPYEITTINYKKNGEEFWVNFTVTPVANDKGWFTHWIAIERDVTVQKNKEIEKELLSQISTKFNLENDYLNAVKELCKTIALFGNFDMVELWVTNIEKNAMTLLSYHLQNPDDELFYELSKGLNKFNYAEGLAGNVWAKNKQLLWNDIDISENFARKEAALKIGLKSILGIPLTFNSQIIAVLQIGTKQEVSYIKKYTEIFTHLQGFIGSELNRKKLENELNIIFDAIPDIICTSDFQGRFLKINKAGCEILGYEEHELLYHSYEEFIHPDDKNVAANEHSSVISGNNILEFETRYITKNNEIVWISWFTQPSIVEGVIYSTGKNITEEKKLRELNREVGALAKIGSWEVDVIAGTLYWSDEVHKLHETDPKTFVPQIEDSINFYREDFRSLIKEKLDDCISNGNQYDIEAIIISQNKREIWVKIIGNSEIRDGICHRIYGSFQDINALKTAEIDRNRSLHTLENSINEIYTFDKKTLLFNHVNKSALNNLGYSKEEILKLTPLDLKPDYTIESFNNLIDPLLSGKKERIVFFTNHKRKDGTIYPVEVHLQLVVQYNNSKYVATILDITERKKAEEDIRDSEEKQRLIMSGALDAIICIDTQENITFWNPQAEVIFGWKQEEVIGALLSELIIPLPFRKYHVEGIKHYLKTGEGKALNVLLELKAIKRNGEEFPIKLTVIPIKQAGEEVFFCAFIRDITDRKKAESQLLTAFKEKISILERITEAFVSIDSNWCYTYMNKKAGEIFNRDPEKMIGKHIWTEFPEGLNQPFHLAYEKAMETQQYIHVEEHYKPYDLWFENHIYPSVDGLSIFFRDVTERKRAEENLRKSNERFEKATEATNDLIWDWDIINDTYYRSQAIERFFGSNAKKILSIKDFWTDSFHPDDIIRIKESIQSAISNQKCFHWEQEYRILHLDNPIIYVIDRGIIIRNNEGKAIRMVGAMTNITEQKELNIQLSELNSSLQKHAIELEKSNEELEQFAFVASHDLQEPLRMITSFMDLLKRKYGNTIDDKGHVYIDFAIDGAKKMKQIILDLLDYSRSNKSIDSKENINLNEIINDYKLLRRKLISEKKATILTHNLPTILSYHTAITQIFHCLIDNAIKYSVIEKPPVIEIKVLEKDKEWEFSVEDNGIGIDPQFFSKIFIIFQRLHNKDVYPGTGVGLSIAKRHIEFLGGKIWLESVVNKGSTFYFSLLKQ